MARAPSRWCPARSAIASRGCSWRRCATRGGASASWYGQSGQQVWASLHEQAWRYFGGSCRYVVLDNLKEGVLKPDLYEPQINPVYATTLVHYGVVADPARVRDPNRKGAVEHAIGHTQATALKGRRFQTLEAQNEFLEHWESTWAASTHPRQRAPPSAGHVRSGARPPAALARDGRAVLHPGAAV
jgi:transposase